MAGFALMGILNVTPDSFSDGGAWNDPGPAIERALAMVDEGAAIIDVGGESTRPGAAPVPAPEELRRVVPVVRGLAARSPSTVISVDTTKAEVARAAIEAGARYVNDVGALRGDPGMAPLLAGYPDVRVCLMHMLGQPGTMQDDPRYDDVVAEVASFLEARACAAAEAGIDPGRIDLDPGIGFGKTTDHNLGLLAHLGQIVALGRPVVLGASRKGTLGRITGRERPADRVAASVATSVVGYAAGVRTFRVHDVAAHRDALLVAEAIDAAR